MTATAMALLYGASAGRKKADDFGGGGGGGIGGIRLRRLFILVLLICCSPILIPLLMLASPLIVLLCFAAVCLRRPCQRLTREDLAATTAGGDHCGDGVALLHRYLEDQLALALAFGEEILAS